MNPQIHPREGQLNSLPIASHLVGSEVLKMLREEEGVMYTGGPPSQNWPHNPQSSGRQALSFMTKCARTGDTKKVVWPPKEEEGVVLTTLPSAPSTAPPEAYTVTVVEGVPPPVPPRPANYPQNAAQTNMTTAYPSGLKLKSEMPIEQPIVKVVPSQPAFKISKPLNVSGDKVWPPRQNEELQQSQTVVRELIKPKKQNRDYTEFFAQNALPTSYTSYRAPPGTQHRNTADDDVTNM